MLLQNINSLCARKKITIATLERKAGLSNGAIGKWKKSEPKLYSVVRVAKALKVSVDFLLREPKEKKDADETTVLQH